MLNFKKLFQLYLCVQDFGIIFYKFLNNCNNLNDTFNEKICFLLEL